jgi:hypothetical protein
MRFILATLAIVVTLPFCTKKGNNSEWSYYGTWELRSSDYGFSGYHEYPKGNGNKLVITKDSIYEYGNNELHSTHAFNLTKGTLRGFGDDRTADKLDAYAGIEMFFELQGNKLARYIGIPAADGGHSVYERIR